MRGGDAEEEVYFLKQRGSLWPSDLIIWVLGLCINSQLISCLSSWTHHSPDYRIRLLFFLIPLCLVKVKALISPVAPVLMLDCGIFQHHGRAYENKALSRVFANLFDFVYIRVKP